MSKRVPVEDFLRKHGFHCYGPDSIYDQDKTVWGNKKVHVYQWKIKIHGMDYTSFEIASIFENENHEWLGLRFYSLSEESLRTRFKEKCRLISNLRKQAEGKTR